MNSTRTVILLTLWGLSWSVMGYSAAPHRKQQIDEDVRNLYSAMAGTRKHAAARLVASGPDAIPALVGVICDKSRSHFDRAWPAAAQALGELKAASAAPCLLNLLGSCPVISSLADQAIAEDEPAFLPLIQIGEAAVPAISQNILFLEPYTAYLALRILRTINTPSAKAAAERYIEGLEDRVRLAKEVLGDFRYGPHRE